MSFLASPCAATAGGIDRDVVQLDRRRVPHIVNGIRTQDAPEVGAFLVFDGEGYRTNCSGTLIGCRTVLTAAHCFCTGESTEDCVASGQIEAVRQASVFFLQHAGAFNLESVRVNPDYKFTARGDLAIITLDRPPQRIHSALVNQIRRPPRGIRGTIVGFGISSSFTGDFGVKNTGRITVDDCVDGVASNRHVCWEFGSPVGPAGEDSTICRGDSGGPVFVELDGAARVAGVTAGTTNNCQAPDGAFATDTFAHEDWIRSEAGDDVETLCTVAPRIGEAGIEVLAVGGELSLQAFDDYSFQVAPGTQELRIGLNGSDFSGAFNAAFRNDFDLLVRRGSAPSGEEVDCREDAPGPYGYCGFQVPGAGTWFVRVVRYAGRGPYQLTVSLVQPQCIGDCDANGQVTVDEIVSGVNIALGGLSISACSKMDGDAGGTVTVDEILTAIDAGLNGCPG